MHQAGRADIILELPPESGGVDIAIDDDRQCGLLYAFTADGVIGKDGLFLYDRARVQDQEVDAD